LHSFIPLIKNKEPDTWIIIDWIRTKFPDVRISLPRVVEKTRELQNFYFDDRFPLKKNKWGLEEPTQGEATQIQDIDLVIVPLMAFDRKGNRVGYGKGFYDKFLAKTRPDCKRVGLSFFEPVDHIDNITSQDMPLHHCITPKNFYKF
jgi:5-formyltetrahydrofolate cyclo-ligase